MPDPTPLPPHERDSEPDDTIEDELAAAGAERATVLTDGVVAIALTLLALDLKPDLPTSTDSRQLAHYLHGHAGQYLAFALAFYLIAQYWLVHHRLTRSVRRAAPRLLVLTLFFLFTITLAPVTTYMTGALGNSLATTLFAANIFAISAVLSAMGAEIHGRCLDDRPETPLQRRRRRTRNAFTLAIPALVAALAWSLGSFASLFYLLFFLIDPVADALTRRARSTG